MDRWPPLLRWTLIVWPGECLAFAIPATVWSVLASLEVPPVVLLFGVALAGLGEGAVLGFAQSQVLPLFVAGVDPRRWVQLTAAGAFFAWGLGMLPSTLSDLGAPLGVTIAVGVVAAPLLVLALSGPQAWLLRGHIEGAWWWVVVNVAAWGAGLPMTFISGLFVDEGSSTTRIAIAFGTGGVAMAFIAALGLGAGLRWMVRTGPRAARQM
ncbi:MAG: hypothetical protein AB7T37_14785 [Dehalococcoidia bacterium]